MRHPELAGFRYRFERAEPGERTLLLLHGTGRDENDLIPLGRLLDAAANLLSPRGKVLENGYPRFFRRFGEGILDVEDLKARTHELVEFVEKAAKEHDFDPDRVTAVGYSNGANIAVSTLFLSPAVLNAAILFRPMYPFDPDGRPDLRGVRVFIASGQRDPLIAPSDALRLADSLKGAGAEVTHHWSPGGHALAADEVYAAKAWLEQDS